MHFHAPYFPKLLLKPMFQSRKQVVWKVWSPGCSGEAAELGRITLIAFHIRHVMQIPVGSHEVCQSNTNQ